MLNKGFWNEVIFLECLFGFIKFLIIKFINSEVIKIWNDEKFIVWLFFFLVKGL